MLYCLTRCLEGFATEPEKVPEEDDIPESDKENGRIMGS
jgi:hypothetical protein